jgi:Gamma-glutamyltransferase
MGSTSTQRRAAARNLDCFVAVPGLGAEPREVALLELDIPFGTELVHYAVGIGSCGVPGVPAGLDALWNEYGRLPWPRLGRAALASRAVRSRCLPHTPPACGCWSR